MVKIAILTPTYNRAKCLDSLYNSLLKQTNYNFVWYIVDDGSTDETKQKVEFFKDNEKFEVEYIYKQNGGKHTALNVGVNQIKEPLTFIVDSDDYLTVDAVETILQDYSFIKDKKNVAGLSYLRMDTNGKCLGKQYSKDHFEDTYISERMNNNIWGDKAEIYKTDILKKYPFPAFKGEKFVSEATVWCNISQKYSLYFINKAIYVCEYLEEGYTKNIHKIIYNNPLGAIECYKEMSKKPVKFKLRLKYTVALNVYCMVAKEKIFKHTNSKFWSFMLLVPSWLIYLNKKRKYKK